MAAQLPQDDGDGVRPGAPVAHVLVVVQGCSGGIQRFDQARQGRPVLGGAPREAPGAIAPQLGRAQRLERLGFLREQRRAAVELAGRQCQPPAGGVIIGGGDTGGSGASRQQAGHAPVSALAVSMRTRSACRSVIERFSLAARSRPDRWM